MNQILIDAPLQYYFSTEFIEKKRDIVINAWTLPNKTELSNLGLPNTGKLELFAVGKNKI